MKAVVLKRIKSNDDGTFGELSFNGVVIAKTCEDPWNENQTGISCIPKGKYVCVPHSGDKYKNVWRLEGVPGRSAILIHWGNTEDDTRGCILVGDRFGTVNGKPAVLNSKATVDKLRGILPPKFIIVIEGVV